MAIYHASRTRGLKVLEPRVGTHKQAWVYATVNPVLALTYGAEWCNYDFMQTVDQQGKVYLSECYEGAFDTIYKGRNCSLYELEDSGFERKTSFVGEVVSPNSAKVLGETKIEDIYAELLKHEKAGELVVNRYEKTEWYKNYIESYIIESLVKSGWIKPSEVISRLINNQSNLSAEAQKANKPVIEKLRKVVKSGEKINCEMTNDK